MAKETVNLDALIPRGDISIAKPTTMSGAVHVSQLATKEHYYRLLRKPDFQRETNDWNIDNVVSLVRSFRDGHLIPAVILWGAEGYIFVIDGAHRLSVFVAWVNNDYGDGPLSQAFFKNDIPESQKRIAEKCRAAIIKENLTYEGLVNLTQLASRTPEQLQWCTNIVKPVDAQWVNGDSSTALRSFININQRAVSIDPTERFMIENLNSPLVISTRAIVNSAKGHPYWGNAKAEHRETIEKKAKLIYDAIFEPEGAQAHTHTELQAAGPAHTAGGLRIALELVKSVNVVDPKAKHHDDDSDGSRTARTVEKTHGVVKYLAGKDYASLNLHPAVYFWGPTGNHRPSVFLAVLGIIQEMIAKDELIMFTKYRARFEEFLVGNANLVKNILGKYGGWGRSVEPIKKALLSILDGLKDGKNDEEIEAFIFKDYKNSDSAGHDQSPPVDQWRQTKSALRIKASLESAPRCGICKARLVMADASDDHIRRREDGGPNSVENAHLTHRFCNHGFKEYFVNKGEPLPEIDAIR
jgi:hypothetical protein